MINVRTVKGDVLTYVHANVMDWSVAGTVRLFDREGSERHMVACISLSNVVAVEFTKPTRIRYRR